MCACGRDDVFVRKAASVRNWKSLGKRGLEGVLCRLNCFTGGSDRERRPLSLVFVASWRPLLNHQLCLCLPTARWKRSVWRWGGTTVGGRGRGSKFSCTVSGALYSKGWLWSGATNREVVLFSLTWLRMKYIVDVICLAAWVLKAPYYNSDPLFFKILNFNGEGL